MWFWTAALAETLVIHAAPAGVVVDGVQVTPDPWAGCRPMGAALWAAGDAGDSVEVRADPLALGAALECAMQVAEAAGHGEVHLISGDASARLSTRCPPDHREEVRVTAGGQAVQYYPPSWCPTCRQTGWLPGAAQAARRMLGRGEPFDELWEPIALRASGRAYSAPVAETAMVMDISRPATAPFDPRFGDAVETAAWVGHDIAIRVGEQTRWWPPEAVQVERWCAGSACWWAVSLPDGRHPLGPSPADSIQEVPFGLPYVQWSTTGEAPTGTPDVPTGPAPGFTADRPVCWGDPVASAGRVAQVLQAAAGRESSMYACFDPSFVQGAVTLKVTVDRLGRVLLADVRSTTLGSERMDDCAVDALRTMRAPPSDQGVVDVRVSWLLARAP